MGGVHNGWVHNLSRPTRRLAILTLLLAGIWLLPNAAQAAFDLFARHEVGVQFAAADGKPMANAEVRVFAPGEPNRPALTGRTDSNGRFAFPADRDGFWTAEAHAAGEVARASLRVGGAAQHQEPVSPYWLVGGLGVLLALAVWLRVSRARRRAARPGSR